MKYITFSGGFHNSPEIRIRVTEKQYNAIVSGGYSFDEVITPNQLKRLQKHFCGITGCVCGGVYRAEMDLNK